MYFWGWVGMPHSCRYVLWEGGWNTGARRSSPSSKTVGSFLWNPLPEKWVWLSHFNGKIHSTTLDLTHRQSQKFNKKIHQNCTQNLNCCTFVHFIRMKIFLRKKKKTIILTKFICIKLQKYQRQPIPPTWLLSNIT